MERITIIRAEDAADDASFGPQDPFQEFGPLAARCPNCAEAVCYDADHPTHALDGGRYSCMTDSEARLMDGNR